MLAKRVASLQFAGVSDYIAASEIYAPVEDTGACCASRRLLECEPLPTNFCGHRHKNSYPAAPVENDCDDSTSYLQAGCDL